MKAARRIWRARRRSHLGNCSKTAGDGETVTASLPESGVWTGTACNVRGAVEVEAGENPSRLGSLNIEPHQEAGNTSAVVTINRIQLTCCNRAGSIYVPHMSRYTLTLRYDKALFIFEPTDAAKRLAGQKVTVRL